MKKIQNLNCYIFILLVVGCWHFGNSQETVLFGTATHNGGSVFGYDPVENSIETYQDFSFGEYPYYIRLVELDGKLWGTTRSGGAYDYGTIFSIALDGSEYTKVYDFTETTGGLPWSGLLVSGGRLWGMTSEGGASDDGTIYFLNSDGTGFSVVYEFDGTIGGNPEGSLVEAFGKIWGVSEAGIFQMDLDGTEITKVHSFIEETGENPIAGLIEANGKLWGMTRDGGVYSGLNKGGVIYSIESDGTGYTKVHDFDDDHGSFPHGELLEVNGKLWGMARNGGDFGRGVIFNLSLDGTGFNVVKHLESEVGIWPVGGLVESNGKIWGMTSDGGIDSNYPNTPCYGAVFSIELDGTGFTNHHYFRRGNDEYLGYSPLGTLFESNGKLWGLTSTGGGQSGSGVVFNLNNDGTGYTQVHEFESQERNPYGGLLASNGRIWGMTRDGGADRSGAIFSIDPYGNDYTKIHEFPRATINGVPLNGYSPNGALIEADGRIWGTTRLGGDHNGGVIFSFQLDGTNLSVEHNLVSGPAGGPQSGLVVLDDKLWGISTGGGPNGGGSIFSLRTDGTGFVENYLFDEENGTPVGGLSVGNGIVWGVTYNGGATNDGTIFSFMIGTGFSTMHEFDGANGSWPIGDLLFIEDKVWGTTRYSDEGAGVIFRMDLNGENYEVVHNFSFDIYGGSPYSGLTEYNGKLWGTLTDGGMDHDGIIYSINLDGTGFQIEYSLQGENGWPQNSPLLPIIPSEVKPYVLKSVGLTEFALFPNPSSSNFSFKSNEEKLLDEIILTDVNGVEVKSFKYSAKNNYDISDVQNTIYFVHIVRKGEKQFVGRLIKN